MTKLEYVPEPIRVHKNLVIRCLQENPSTWREIVTPTYTGTREEYIAALAEDPREWFIGGVLSDGDEATKKAEARVKRRGRS